MYFEEEINLVGVISERDLNEDTNENEISRILYDALGLGPMFEPLMTDI
jgi:hypothetical protein